MARLTEDDAVGGELTLEALERLDLGRVRELRDMALHLVFAGGDPVRHEVAGVGGAGGLFGELEDQASRCHRRDARTGSASGTVGTGDVAADGVALVPVHAALALLEVHGVAREIPVDEAVAPGVEVEPFLPDRGAGEHEGAEGTVEGGSDGILADGDVPSSVRLCPKRSANTVRTRMASCLDGFSVLRPEEPCVDPCTQRIHDVDELPGALAGYLVGGGVFGPRFLIPEHVPVLVEDRLQVALLAIAEHEAPVGRPRRARPRFRWRAGEGARSRPAG